MKLRGLGILLGAGGIIAAASTIATARRAADATLADDARDRPALDVERAARYFLTLVLLPGWVVPGFGDYLAHRAAKIERTSGTHESLTHLLMLAATGAGVLVGLFFEINEASLLAIGGAALAHEGVVLWDVAYASRIRPPTATEQHFHSFLEVLPFAGLAFTCCLHPNVVGSLFAQKPHANHRFVLKRHMSIGYNASVIALISLLVVIPHFEEFVRCLRVDRTLLPHARPIAEEP